MSRRQGQPRLLWVIALAILPASPLAGQSLTSGGLTGQVEREDGTALYDVAVRVTDEVSGITRGARTERDGRFRISFLPAGDYTVLVERLGYRPQKILGVRIRAGGTTEVRATVRPTQPPVDEVEVVRWSGVVEAAGPGVRQRLPASVLDALPEARREVSEAGRLFSASTAALDPEGLPARLSALVVDGVAVSASTPPDVPLGTLRAAAFPLSAFHELELVGEAVDVELSGWSGSHLSGSTRRGTRTLSASVFGTWSGEALSSSKFFDAASLPHAALQGGAMVSGPIIPDTAVFVVGVEARRLEEALPPAWVPTAIDQQLISVALTNFGVDLESYTAPRLHQSEMLTGAGRFDWQIGGNTALQVRGSIAEVPGTDPDPFAGPATAAGPRVEGRDVSVAALLTSEFSERQATEFRAHYERSVRDYAAGEAIVLPSTRFAWGGITLGADAVEPGRFARSRTGVSQSLFVRAGRHVFKVGGSAVWDAFDQTYARGRAGEFLFADADAFANGRGAFTQTTGTVPVVSFSTPRYGAFLQDSWRPAAGLEVTAGLRFDTERWPAADIRLNDEWLAQTGLSNATLAESHNLLSPRFALTWDVQAKGRWRVDVAAGMHPHSGDPALLAEMLTHDGRIEVRRGVGDLGSWPAPPALAAAPVTGPRLAVPGPEFRPPQTYRATAGITHQLRPRTTLSLSATARRTDFLPRRADVNLLPVASGADQFGRPVYGSLWQDGGLVVAQPGTNRRFNAFDVVSAINADGVSDYLGATITLERWIGRRFGLLASYTYSRTTDDWLGARAVDTDAQFDPFPHAASGMGWDDGRSDFDLPHRLVVVAEQRLPIPLQPRIAAVYRFRSGYPFTPGFREGVDANGDGSGRNDPAFVDQSIAGMSELVAGWDCLGDQAGRFAERNACREPGAHAMDVRFTLDAFRTGRYAAELVVDGLNLIESDVGVFDHALYLVDPGSSLSVDPGTGVVTVPLIANPGFGKLLARHTTGRAIRLGLRLTY